MSDLWTAVLALAILLFLVFAIKQWVMRRLQGLGLLALGTAERAIWLRFLILAPGIFLHEFSHWLTAKVLGVTTGKFSLGPSEFKRRGNRVQVTMGYVMVGRSDPFRASMIGAAPFFFGTIAIILLASYGFHQSLGPWVPPQTRLTQIVTGLPDLFAVADVWLWVYLVFSVSNSMIPSVSDRRGWLEVAIYVGILAAIVFFLVGIPRIPDDTILWAQRGLDYLLFAFALTLIVDVVMGVVIWLLLLIVSFFTHRRIDFG